jgi:hypothetical protein
MNIVKEKGNILETRTKDTKMFHKLVRKNRRQGNDMIMLLEVNGKNYTESENIINGFQEHFSSLATLFFSLAISIRTVLPKHYVVLS